MIFDLSRAHLGDFLLALPAMRPGDQVILRPEYRLTDIQLDWLDSGHGLRPGGLLRGHITDAWLRAAGRDPVRWELAPELPKTLTVVAPDVVSRSKQWRGWGELRGALDGAVWLTGAVPRPVWMSILAQAKTVICPDTGTAHMADALGCPKVVGLYAKHFNTHAPYWCRDYCINKRSMEEITVDDVMERVRV